jgi:hypothetical protein
MSIVLQRKPKSEASECPPKVERDGRDRAGLEAYASYACSGCTSTRPISTAACRASANRSGETVRYWGHLF